MNNTHLYLEILFTNRNKSYGAYNLRKYYPQRLARSLGIAILSVSILYGISSFIPADAPIILPKPVDKPMRITPIRIPAPKPLIKPVLPKPTPRPIAKASTKASIKNIQPTKTPTSYTITRSFTLSTRPTMPVTTITPTSTPSINATGGNAINTINNTNGATGVVSNSTSNTSNTTPTIDIEPSYPGGQAALIVFLQSNLNYPTEAINKNIQGKVILEFEVDEEGRISNIKINTSLIKECDEEAKRVLRLMPKWQPAVYQGKAVRTLWKIPINFELTN
jgi:periplasmic protein TonB